MLKKLAVRFVLAILVFVSAAPPEVPAPATTRKDIAVTVYNRNLAVIREIREVEIPAGVVHLRFEDVSAQIEPTSLSVVSLTAPEAIRLLEQNYEYDLVNPKKLLEKYLGKEVLIARRDESGKETILRATLLSVEGEGVYQIGEQIELGANGRIILPSLPEGLRVRPTLLWLVESARFLKHRLEVSYLTRGLSWEANYVGLVNEGDTRMDVTGWVTLNNWSGTTYENASLKLVAGEVQQAAEKIRAVGELALDRAAPSFSEEAFFEYHLYTLDRRTTLRDRETKQMTLLSAPGVGVTKKYIVWGGQNYYYSHTNTGKQKLPVGAYLEFQNSKENGLGLPLPKGIFRLYKKDASGSEQFIGEDRIDHTPKDEVVRLKVGSAFDLVAERVQTDYRALSGYTSEYAFAIEFRNHKNEAVVIEALEPTWGDWKVVTSTYPPERISATLLRFRVPVDANGKATLEYRIRVRY